MPPIRSTSGPTPSKVEDLQEIRFGSPEWLALVRAEWAEFERPSAWRRSAKGNLTRRWDGEVVVIFKAPGGYKWVVFRPDSEDGDLRSRRTHDTEDQARDDLGDALGIGCR